MIENPEIANDIVRAVSEKLGREAILRKVINRKEYFILDLAFSYFQKADRNRRNDYRSGYLYYEKNNENYLLFVISHSPIMTGFFKNNFDYDALKNIIVDTAECRDENYIRYKIKGAYVEIKTNSLKEFLMKLDEIEKYSFVKSVFSKDKKGKTGVGNMFGLRLAKGFKQSDVANIIEKSWDLFLWLYPSKPIFKTEVSHFLVAA